MSINAAQRDLSEKQLEGVWWYLSDPEEGKVRTQAAAEDGTLERASRTVEWVLAEQYRQAMDPPITTWDDGNVRFVELMRAYRFIVDTENRRCNTRVMEPFRHAVVTGGDAVITLLRNRWCERADYRMFRLHQIQSAAFLTSTYSRIRGKHCLDWQAKDNLR